MEKVAFILGAGAHIPFSFPSGDRLKQLVADELHAVPSQLVERAHAARQALMDCGVSIDRFLATNKDLDDLIRPCIAKVLLQHEKSAIDVGMKDWLGYIWPLMIGKNRGEITRQFVFVTFNYDRTTEYRIARAAAGLWGLPLIDTCNTMDEYGIYHIYGSLGGIGPRARPFMDYGRIDDYHTSGREIKIIGEHSEATTNEIHVRLADATLIMVLGCGYHPENMSVLGLDKLPPKPSRVIIGSCKGLLGQERGTAQGLYPYVTFLREDWDAWTVLRENAQFQNIRASIMLGKDTSEPENGFVFSAEPL